MDNKNQEKSKNVSLSESEQAIIKEKRIQEKNLIDGQKEINAILSKRKLNIVVDPNSPIRNPTSIVVPLNQQ